MKSQVSNFTHLPISNSFSEIGDMYEITNSDFHLEIFEIFPERMW